MTDVTPQPEPPAPEPPLPLPVLMGRVLADVAPVGKNSTAPSNMGGYSFRGIEDVLAALKPAMAKHGVFCVPHIAERHPAERPLGSGKIMFVVDLFIVWTFYGPAGDTIQADAWGQGTDMGDKATQKAMTSAFKSMLMQTFVIGDSATDAEAHSVPETQQQVDPDAWFKENGWAGVTEHDEMRAEWRSKAAQLDDRGKHALKAWRTDKGLTWEAVWTRAEVEELAEKVRKLTVPAQAPAGPVPAPPSVGEADPEALVEHLKAMDRADLTGEFVRRGEKADETWTDDKMRQKLGLKMLAEGWRPAQPSLLDAPRVCHWCGTERTDTNELVDYGEDGIMHAGCHDERLADKESAADPGRPF